MSTDAFEQTNWVWKFSLFQQQVGEWLEYQFSQFQKTLPALPPGWSISPWLSDLLRILFWLGLGLFVVWIGWRLWQEFNPYIYGWLNAINNSSGSRAKADSRETSIALLLNQAQEFHRQHNYTEACRCLYLGEKQKALDFYNQALPISRAVGDRGGEAGTLNNIGLVYSALGEKQKALDFYNQALPLMRAVGDPYGEVTILDNIRALGGF